MLKVEIEKKKKTKSISPGKLHVKKIKKQLQSAIPDNLILNNKIEKKYLIKKEPKTNESS
jgi:hypothetical protein